jgi:hypothetical protein
VPAKRVATTLSAQATGFRFAPSLPATSVDSRAETELVGMPTTLVTRSIRYNPRE